MGQAVRPFSLGWHPVEPGPGPRSPLLDSPPKPGPADYEVLYRQWRTAVEADEQKLVQHQMSGPLWHPVPLPRDVCVLPVYGGTAGALEQVATTLVTSGMEHGLAACRVVNLSGWDLSRPLKRQMQGARRNRAQFEEVSPRGSTVNLFGNPRRDELVALLADALRITAERSGGRQVQQDRRELDRVVRVLRGQVTLERIVDAVDVALGGPHTSGSLVADEIRDLQDYHAGVVSQRRATQDRLSDLHLGLEAIRAFERSSGRAPEVLGAGRISIRWYDVVAGSSTDEVELGRELIARAVLQTFTLPGPEELLVVIGAERLADDVREGLVDAAQRLHKRVALVYTQISDAGRRMLGYAGSDLTVFLRLPNPADAAVAAEFLGREYKFVVNGVSIAEGRTQDWNTSYGTSTSQGTSRSRTSTSGSGYSAGAFNFSRSVGSSVSSSFERGSSTTSSTGGSSSTTSTTSTGRVHEYVLEPEVFQQMPDDLMLVVSNGTVVVASCQNDVRWSAQTSTDALALP